MKSQVNKPLYQGLAPRPPWALRRKNCKLSLRCFCVVGSGMMGS